MAFAVIRVVFVSAANQQPDQTWLCLWSSIKQAVCQGLLHSLKADRRIFQPYGSLIICINNTPAMAAINGRMSGLLPDLRTLFTKSNRPTSRRHQRWGIQDRQELLFTIGFIFQR
jgi:hypothetical protein